jgi:hypothetical protein
VQLVVLEAQEIHHPQTQVKVATAELQQQQTNLVVVVVAGLVELVQQD